MHLRAKTPCPKCHRYTCKNSIGLDIDGFLKSLVDHDQPKRIDYWAWTSAGYSADWPNKAKISVQAWAKHQIDSLS
jgi:hypothetical protein